MRKTVSLLLFIICIGILFSPRVFATWIWSTAENKFVQANKSVNKTADELYQEANSLRKKGDQKRAISNLTVLLRQYPDSAYAPEAQMLLGTILEDKGNLVGASKKYQDLIKKYPQSERIDEAVEHLFKIANLFLTGQKQKLMGVSILPVNSKAVEIFEFIIQNSPYGPYGEKAQFQLGLAYRKDGKYGDAVSAFQKFIENYSHSDKIDEARYQLAETSYQFSKAASNDQKLLDGARANLQEFIDQHGNTNLADKADSLKKELDEKDAEKNYRIALYYEKQGYAESAKIYYEDVIKRYQGTSFSKKAEERLTTLMKPAKQVNKDQEAIEKRLAEVNSMLQAVEKDSAAKTKAVKQGNIGEVLDVTKQLQEEKTSLELEKKRFQNDAEQKYEERRQALRTREKSLREKRKIFEARKKKLQDRESPELNEAFQKWSVSLEKEGEDLAEEKERLAAVREQLAGKPSKMGRWLPSFGKQKSNLTDDLIRHKEKSWDRLVEEKTKLGKEHVQHEKELKQTTKQVSALEAKQLAAIKQKPDWEELLSPELRKQKEELRTFRNSWDQTAHELELMKVDYEKDYGAGELKQMLSWESLKEVIGDEKLADSDNLEEVLKQLEQNKLELSQEWLTEREIVNTVSKAFGESTEKKIETKDSAVRPEPAKNTGTDTRHLKKRMKHTEREIRKRVDQVQDWQRKNDDNVEKMKQLLRSHEEASFPVRAGYAVAYPFVGTYRLTKAFFFGLPEYGREVTREARKEIASTSTGSMSSARLEKIRKLQEEIELQSILIQGRLKEIKELRGQLTDLQKQAESIPGFVFQSLLVDRYPTLFDESLSQAKAVMPEVNEQTVLFDRLDRETEKLQVTEKKMNEIDKKIKAVGSAIEVQKAPKSVSTGGSSETAAAVGDAVTIETKKKALEQKLKSQEKAVKEKEKSYQAAELQFEEALTVWFHESLVAGDLKAIVSKDALNQEWGEWINKETQIRDSLKKTIRAEKKVSGKQMNYLDRKSEVLQKRLNHLKNDGVTKKKMILEELDLTRSLRKDLSQEILKFETALK